jgi:hypothetical protein
VIGFSRGGVAAHTSLDILEVFLQVPIQNALHQSRSHGSRTHRAAPTTRGSPVRKTKDLWRLITAVILQVVGDAWAVRGLLQKSGDRPQIVAERVC